MAPPHIVSWGRQDRLQPRDGLAVSAVICTRNRADKVPLAAKSILANVPSPTELLIVDQSDHDDTRAALEQFLDDPRVRYVRERTKGVSSGRNSALRASRSDIFVFMDDDCESTSNFLSAAAAAFSVDPRVAIVYGSVLPSTHDRRVGFIPTRVQHGTHLARTVSEASAAGMGACMALRRQAWETVGGFDEMLGVGAPLGAAEEFDITIRALLAGFYVYDTEEVAVVHHGFYPWQAHHGMVRRYNFGTGAAMAKHLRCRAATVTPLAARLALRWAVAEPPIEVGHTGGRAQRLTAFLRGAVAGMRMPVDPTTVLFGSAPASHLSSVPTSPSADPRWSRAPWERPLRFTPQRPGRWKM